MSFFKKGCRESLILFTDLYVFRIIHSIHEIYWKKILHIRSSFVSLNWSRWNYIICTVPYVFVPMPSIWPTIETKFGTWDLHSMAMKSVHWKCTISKARKILTWCPPFYTWFTQNSAHECFIQECLTNVTLSLVQWKLYSIHVSVIIFLFLCPTFLCRIRQK